MLATQQMPNALSPPDHSSVTFLNRLMAHDADAFAELVKDHGPRLLAVATRYLHCRADAEDAVQDALVNVTRHIGGFNGASTLETWLHRIVVNCSLMILRTRRRKPMLTNAETQLAGDTASRVDRGAFGSPGEGMDDAERRRRLLASIRALPAVQRSAVDLRYGSGLTVKSIANLLELSSSTVKTRLHRARRTLGRSVELQIA